MEESSIRCLRCGEEMKEKQKTMCNKQIQLGVGFNGTKVDGNKTGTVSTHPHTHITMMGKCVV